MELKPEPAAASDETALDSAGESLAQGRYVIFGRLGRGAQAETLEAVDKQLGNPVAIKRFAVGHAKTWKDVELAEREARTLASLSHPCLPQYVDHFEEQGSLYLVMERVEGQSLSSYVKDGHRLSLPELRALLGTLSDVLSYLHSRIPPVIHRDIKPGNIIRRPDGTFCLVDFGSVRDGLRPEGGSTVVGTFGYMAPEQFQGRASPGTDIYAVGALLLALVTGKPPEELPHQGLAIDAASAISGAVPPKWVQMISQMVNINPDERPSSLAPLIEVLDRASESSPAHSQPAETAQARVALETEDRDPDSSFTVMVGSGFGLIPFLALFIARVAIWAALGVVVPLVLRILSIFFGWRLRLAANQVSAAGLHARARLSAAAKHLQSAEPFVLQGRHYGHQQHRDPNWKAARREWRKQKREWKRNMRVDIADFVQDIKDDAMRAQGWDAHRRGGSPFNDAFEASDREAKYRRAGAKFSDDDGSDRAGKTRNGDK